MSMGKAIDLKLLFEGLIAQFGFGKISAFRASNIMKRIPKYRNVKINETDSSERKLYNGKYTGYTDEELCEVIESELIAKQADEIINYAVLHTERESNCYRGKLVHFREVDKRLDLPPGTARRLLVQVAGQFGLEPDLLKDNIVRFKPAEWFKAEYITKKG